MLKKLCASFVMLSVAATSHAEFTDVPVHQRDFSEAALELKDMNYRELNQAYKEAGMAIKEIDGFTAPGPIPEEMHAIYWGHAWTPWGMASNSIIRRLAVSVTTATLWNGKEFYRTDANSCDYSERGTVFRAKNNLPWLGRIFAVGFKHPIAELSVGPSVEDSNDAIQLHYHRKAPYYWYIRDEMRMTAWNSSTNEGTWFGHMYGRPIPGLNRLSIPVGSWFVDRAVGVECMRDEFIAD